MSEVFMFLAVELIRRIADGRARRRRPQIGVSPVPASPAPAPPLIPRAIIALGADLAIAWPNVTATDVHRAYRRRARRAHPDGGGSDAKFDALRKNYEAAIKVVDRRYPHSSRS